MTQRHQRNRHPKHTNKNTEAAHKHKTQKTQKQTQYLNKEAAKYLTQNSR